MSDDYCQIIEDQNDTEQRKGPTPLFFFFILNIKYVKCTHKEFINKFGL